jgi:protein gp37
MSKIIVKGRPLYPYGFAPTIHLERFEAKSPSKPSVIFLGSMGDMCGSWEWFVAEEENARFLPWMLQRMVRSYCADHCRHQFIILTKNPGGLCVPRETGQLPANIVFGVSVPGDGEREQQRLEKLRIIQERGIVSRIAVSFEPALRPLPELWEVEDNTAWLIIGADTSPGAKPVDFNHLDQATRMATKLGWRIWIKNNAISQLPCKNWPQEHLSMPEAD